MAPGNHSPPSIPETLRLATLSHATVDAHRLRFLHLDGPGPRYIPLQTLQATQIEVRTANRGTLPALGLTWSLAGHGLALTLLLRN